MYEGESFGYYKSIAGEVVFSTGMVGYPESLTDPSYAGQILVMTYPLVGNYGVPEPSQWESSQIWVSGLVVSSYVDTPSYYSSTQTLREWLVAEKVPGVEIRDTRAIAKYLRETGAALGKLEVANKVDWYDPNKTNVVSDVSTIKPEIFGNGNMTVVLIDCGAKRGIRQALVDRGVKVVVVPWNFDLSKASFSFDGVVISNGPGDPKMAKATIATVKWLLGGEKALLGICLGNQILALAAGGDTYKLKYGHRSQNQPVGMRGSERCFLTTQNHGFAVGKIPKGFEEWFINLNDKTNEGIRHKSKPFLSVQFHPEAKPGPVDTGFIFDDFVKLVRE